MLSKLKNKSAGFWLSSAAIVLVVVLSLAYNIMYAGKSDYTVCAFLFPLVAVVLSVVLYAFGFDELSPVCLLVGFLAGFAFYVYSMYYYVSVVMVGIDAESFDFAFIFTMVVFLAGIVLSAVSMFFPSKAKGEVQQ